MLPVGAFRWPQHVLIDLRSMVYPCCLLQSLDNTLVFYPYDILLYSMPMVVTSPSSAWGIFVLVLRPCFVFVLVALGPLWPVVIWLQVVFLCLLRDRPAACICLLLTCAGRGAQGLQNGVPRAPQRASMRRLGTTTWLWKGPAGTQGIPNGVPRALERASMTHTGL